MATSPRLRTRDTELKPETSSFTAYLRGGKLILGLLNPVVAVLSIVFTFILVRVQKVKWVTLAGVLASGVAFFAGGFRSYFLWVRELRDRVVVHGLTDVGSFASSQVVQWLTAQLLLGVPVAVVVAGIIALARGRYKATWREEKKAKEYSDKELAAANQKMKPWANQKPVAQLDDLAIRLGTAESTLKPFDIPLAALRLHTFIAGPSGFGKTTTILELIKGLVLAPAAAPFRIGTVFITMKPETDITLALEQIGAAAGRKVHIITEDGQGATATYNPLRHGTAAKRRNIVIKAEADAVNGGFSEAHFLRSGSRFTLLALRALEAAVNHGKTYTKARVRYPWRMDLEHLAKIMRLGVLATMKDELADVTLAADIESYLKEVEEDPQVADGVSGMRNRVAVIAEGAAGNVLVEDEGGLDLREAIRDGDIVIFNLNAAEDLEAAQYIANLAISDYTAALSDLAKDRWHLLTSEEQEDVQTRLNVILVDEFGALGGKGLVDVVERSRSYGGAALLSTQSYSALETIYGGFKDRLMTNTMVKLFHQVDVKADELSDMLGTKEAMKETLQTLEDKDLLGSQARASGQGTVREVEVFQLHPNVLRSLNPGEIVGVIKSPRRIEKVKVRKTGITSGEKIVRQPPAEEPLPASPEVAVAPVQVADTEEISWDELLAEGQEPVQQEAEEQLEFLGFGDDDDDAMDMPFK